MHFLPFTFKRAHHATLKLLRPLAARHALTPARFDLLYVLHAKGSSVEPYQYRIAEALGLSRTTICKMVDALEKAGLVVRTPEFLFDHRRRRVEITRYGRHCMRQVLKALRRREIEKPLLDAVSFWKCNTRNERTDFLIDMTDRTQRVLRGLYDGADPRFYKIPRRSEFRRLARHRPPRPTPNFRKRSLEWFLLKGFFESERMIS